MCNFDWNMLLEYLKVLFSWPPVLALLLVWFMRQFRSEISKLIERIKRFTLPGGSEVELNEIEKLQEAAVSPDLLFPRVAESVGHIHADLTAPSPTLQASGHAAVDREHTNRVRALYPGVDADAVVEWLHVNPGPALDDYVDKVFQLQCERTFNIIFGTQVLTLDFLDNPVLTGPAPGSALATLYGRHLELTGSADRSLADFMGFLLNSGLVKNVGTIEGPLYEITAKGREFLLYIKRHYPLQWNEKPF